MKSWEIDINNKDLPKLHRESNMNNYLYDCEKTETFNINDKTSVEKYLQKANILIKVI